MTQDVQESEWVQNSQSPFAEAMPTAEDSRAEAVGYESWSENLTPFTETINGAATQSEAEQMYAEAFASLRDESFDEALAYLAEETEQAVSDRFSNETAENAAERERYADAHLSSLRFEARQYLDNLETGLTGMDVESLNDEQLDEALDRFDPRPSDLTPAGEEFLGKLIRKAKNIVKSVVKTATNVAGKVVSTVGKVASFALGPILKKLKALINPLLKRVLQFAIGRLPAPLQAAARTLAAKISLEAEAEGEAESEGEAEESFDESPASPANLTDVEALAESFDAALAEAMTSEAGEYEGESSYESFEGEGEGDGAGRELEQLAEARAQLLESFRNSGDQENLAPAIEQFVPALLAALRLGINLVGRPKVVNFLAKFLARLIGRWVGPTLSKPLSNAIVDTGLRLVMLENENGEQLTDEAAPLALASAVEDTVRELAESEDYVFENEELLQLAASEAFSQAVATHFPPRFVKASLQQAPSLGGTFVPRRIRSLRPYHKYSRVPEVDITPQVADALPSFGGTTVGAALRAAGISLPMRARVHLYQAAAGTTLPRTLRVDRTNGGRGYFNATAAHPLTPHAAGLLLREPRLGVSVPAAYLRSRNRMAVGQRFYVIEPLGAANALALPNASTSRAGVARVTPSHSWTVVNLKRGKVTVGFYLSEADAQGIAATIRQGGNTGSLLQALNATLRGLGHAAAKPRIRFVSEQTEEFEDLALSVGKILPPGISGMLRKRLRGWVLPALAKWVKGNAEAFVRVANHPDPGVTIRVQLSAVPGLDVIGNALGALRAGTLPRGILGALRGTPTIAVTMKPGRPRK